MHAKAWNVCYIQENRNIKYNFCARSNDNKLEKRLKHAKSLSTFYIELTNWISCYCYHLIFLSQVTEKQNGTVVITKKIKMASALVSFFSEWIVLTYNFSFTCLKICNKENSKLGNTNPTKAWGNFRCSER